MKSSFKKAPGSKIEVEVALTAPEFKDYWQRKYDEVLSHVEIKGFRPGTAPKDLADKAIDKEKVFNEAAERAVRESLDDVSKQNEWILIDAPQIEILEASPSGEVGLKYKATLIVFPNVVLGNYKKIAKRVFGEKKEIVIEPKEIEQSLEWLQKSRAKIIRTDHPAQKGNVVEADIETHLNGKPLEGGSSKNDRFVIGESGFLSGFDDHIETHSAGENIEFSITPQENKKFEFKVSIKGIFERELPVLDDEFAKGLGSSFKNLDDIKKSINEGLRIEKEKKETEKRRIKVLEEIAKDSTVDLPESMVQRTLEHMVADFKAMASSETMNEEELRTSLRKEAVKNVTNNLVIYKITKEEHLEPTEEEIEVEMKKAEPEIKNDVDRERYRDYSYSVVQSRKVFEFLEKQAEEQL